MNNQSLYSSMSLPMNYRFILSAFFALNFCLVLSTDLITRQLPLTMKFLLAASTWNTISFLRSVKILSSCVIILNVFRLSLMTIPSNPMYESILLCTTVIRAPWKSALRSFKLIESSLWLNWWWFTHFWWGLEHTEPIVYGAVRRKDSCYVCLLFFIVCWVSFQFLILCEEMSTCELLLPFGNGTCFLRIKIFAS